MASLRESDPPSDASDATLFASMAEPIPEMAAEPLPGRPRFSRTIHGNFCERKLSVYNPNNNDRFSLARIFYIYTNNFNRIPLKFDFFISFLKLFPVEF